MLSVPTLSSYPGYPLTQSRKSSPLIAVKLSSIKRSTVNIAWYGYQINVPHLPEKNQQFPGYPRYLFLLVLTKIPERPLVIIKSFIRPFRKIPKYSQIFSFRKLWYFRRGLSEFLVWLVPSPLSLDRRREARPKGARGVKGMRITDDCGRVRSLVTLT